MRICVALIAVVGCFKPTPSPGSPCDDTHPCPDPLVCSPDTQTCQSTAMLPDAPVDAHIVPGCMPSGPELCGDGIDQDCDGVDPPCPANDAPGGAIDITAGGTFTVDLGAAHDDAKGTINGSLVCGGVGGRDVFYKIHLLADEAYYLDTFGSSFDTIIRVYHGACAGGNAPNSTKCHNDQCTTTQTQGIWDLTAGDSCIVVDQNTSAETTGSLVLHVERGHRTGTLLAATNSGTTVGGTDQTTGSCGDTGNDAGYYFMGCPGQVQQVTATTCNAATLWDTALYARGSTSQLACNDDDATCTGNVNASSIAFTANGAHLFWIIVDAGAAGITGAYEVDATIN